MSKLFIVVISILILIISVDNSYSSSVTIQFDKEQYDSDASIVLTVINPAESNQVEIQVSSFTGLNYHLYADELEDTPGIFQVVLPISLFLINNDDVITASYEYVDQVTSVPVIITTQAKIIKIDKQIIHESSLDVPFSLSITNESNVEIDSVNSNETVFFHGSGPGMLVLKLSHITEGWKLMKWNTNTIDIKYDMKQSGLYQVSLTDLSLNTTDNKIIREFFVFPLLKINEDSKVINSTKLYNGIPLDDALLFQSNFHIINQTSDVPYNETPPISEQTPPISEQTPPISEQTSSTTNFLSNQQFAENKQDVYDSNNVSLFVTLQQNYLSLLLAIVIASILTTSGIIQFKRIQSKNIKDEFVTILNNKKNIAKISSYSFEIKHYFKLLEEQFPHPLFRYLLCEINPMLYNLSLLYSSTQPDKDNTILQHTLRSQICEFSQKMDYFKHCLFSSQLFTPQNILKNTNTTFTPPNEITYVTNVEVFIKDYGLMLENMKLLLSDTGELPNGHLDQVLSGIQKTNFDTTTDHNILQDIKTIKKINNYLERIFENCKNLSFEQ